jgi:cytoskeletal protein RodZ
MTSLGEQLRNARRTKSKSLEDISKDTNISKRYLKALEEDNYDIFPGRVYIKGFLTTYAKYVGLDPEAIAEQYDKLTTFSKLLSGEASEKEAHKPGKRQIIRRRLLLLLIAFLVIILSLVVLLWLRRT